MTTLYLVCFGLGTVALVLTLVRAGAPAPSVRTGLEPRLGEDLTVPGARVDPSDEYAVAGGAGGAEGEGSSPAYEDGANGGIGGAEGGIAGDRIPERLPHLSAFLSAALAGFGGGAFFLETGVGLSTPIASLLGVLIGLVLGGVAIPLLRHVRGVDEGETGV